MKTIYEACATMPLATEDTRWHCRHVALYMAHLWDKFALPEHDRLADKAAFINFNAYPEQSVLEHYARQ